MRTRTLDAVLAADASDRRERRRSAMLRVRVAGDVLVGVTKGLDISLFTTRDSTTVHDPSALAAALAEAHAFTRKTRKTA